MNSQSPDTDANDSGLKVFKRYWPLLVSSLLLIYVSYKLSGLYGRLHWGLTQDLFSLRTETGNESVHDLARESLGIQSSIYGYSLEAALAAFIFAVILTRKSWKIGVIPLILGFLNLLLSIAF